MQRKEWKCPADMAEVVAGVWGCGFVSFLVVFWWKTVTELHFESSGAELN